MEDKISIIVPMYNAEKFIGETLNTVLSQTYTNFEVIFADDVSKDNSASIIEACTDERVRLIRLTENKGAYNARNEGLKAATGRYIAFLDADDIWDREKLSHEIEFMKQMDAGFVFTGYEFADENGLPTGAVVRVPRELSYKRALHNTTIFTSTVLIDRTKVPDELIMMPAIKSEDTATWWRILKAGYKAYGLNETLVKYRRPGKSLSSNKFEAIKRIWNLYMQIAGLSKPEAAFHFALWAVLAVFRRI